MTESTPATGVTGEMIDTPLTREEDDELRRLHYLAQHGTLSERSKERIVELRLRDRRRTVRPTREL